MKQSRQASEEQQLSPVALAVIREIAATLADRDHEECLRTGEPSKLKFSDGCGCAEHDACPEGCVWAEADLCTSCVAAPGGAGTPIYATVADRPPQTTLREVTG